VGAKILTGSTRFSNLAVFADEIPVRDRTRDANERPY
jgi:hypothetical protein